jgi:hypothetical protein
MDKQTVLELLNKALEAIASLTINGLTVNDPDAEDAFKDMYRTIEHAMETVDYYGD